MMEDVRWKRLRWMMEDVRRKREDVVSHRNCRYSAQKIRECAKMNKNWHKNCNKLK